MSKELIEKLESFLDKYQPEYVNTTLESIFEGTPEGDFSWEQDEVRDWDAWYDPDSQSWEKTAYATNIGRKNGFHWIEGMSCDTDGNWDMNLCFSEEDGDEFTSFDEDFKSFCSTEDYFIGWAEYWLYCATEGTDQLNECSDCFNTFSS